MSALTKIKKFLLINDEKYNRKIANSTKNIKKFEKFKEFCANKNRCFIIGNGPSLTKSDMDLLSNEITFVCNRFVHIYDDYRPTAYFCQDPTILKNEIANLNKSHARFKLVNPLIRLKNVFFKKNYSNDTIFYHVIRKLKLNGQPPKFSTSFEEGFYEGYTICFSMIQCAAILGFKEIYLLGVDFNYVIKDGKIDDSSYPASLKGMKTGGLPDIEYNYKAFCTAQTYAKEHGIRIVNCSRNTKLDVFEKIQLEKVLEV